MSNIDKHSVQAVADLKAGYTLGHADVAILNELARIALASLEAEAVAWISERNLKNLGKSYSVYVKHEPVMVRPIPLYTAPPAPAYVPDAIHSQGEKSVGDDYYALGWNACRAAMLQGAEPVSNRDELTDAVNGLLAVMDEYPESLVPINRDSAVVRQLRAAAAPQQEVK